MITNHVYEVGAARADITPPIGIRLVGYAVREGVSQAVDEPLTATVLVIRAAEQTVALISLDIVMISVEVADQLRQACAEVLGTSMASVLVNCSHSHSSPCIHEYSSINTREQLELQKAFRQLVLDQCVEAIHRAAADLKLARIATGWGQCDGNINRRQKGPDGNVLLGEDPNGPCDHSVGVIRIDDLEGQPIAIVYRYSCHTVTLGPKTNVISPDFIGPARQLIESSLHCPSLFLQGCAGNINPASGIGQDHEGKEDMLRLGHMLGSEVLKVAQNLRTHRKRGKPKLVQSVAMYWLYEYEQIPSGSQGRIQCSEHRMELPLAPFPDLDEVEQERQQWADKLAKARNSGEREWNINPLLHFDAWAQRRLEAAERCPNPLRISFPVQVIDIDGLQIVALPFEPMAETGLALRQQIGADTFIIGYSNGTISYLPTPQINTEGGMESKLGYKSYLLSSEVPGQWEPAIQQKVLQLSAKTKDLEPCQTI